MGTGVSEGAVVGAVVGAANGTAVGRTLGDTDGVAVGMSVGCAVGAAIIGEIGAMPAASNKSPSDAVARCTRQVCPVGSYRTV